MSFDPQCTYAEAEAADAVHIAKLGGSITDPRRPLAQWHAMRRLDELQNQSDQGDPIAFMWAIRVCAFHGLVMPLWLAKGYVEKFDAVLNCKVRTWDEAFGKPYPGTHLAALKKRRELLFPVWIAVTAKLNTEPGKQIEEIFGDVAQELRQGERPVKDYYYEMRDLLGLGRD